MNEVSGACLPSAAISAGCVTTREPLGEAFLIVSVRMRNQVNASKSSTLKPCTHTTIDSISFFVKKLENMSASEFLTIADFGITDGSTSPR